MRSGAERCGAVRSGAGLERGHRWGSGAERCGAVQSGAERCGAVRDRRAKLSSWMTVAAKLLRVRVVLCPLLNFFFQNEFALSPVRRKLGPFFNLFNFGDFDDFYEKMCILLQNSTYFQHFWDILVGKCLL